MTKIHSLVVGGIVKKKFVILLFVTIFILILSIENVFALSISYPSINFRLENQPTYCIDEPSGISDSHKESLINMAQKGVTEWKNKLQDAELENKLLWDMKYKLGSASSNGCDITIYFQPNIEDLHQEKDIITLGVFQSLTRSIQVAFENVQSGTLYNVLIHEIGHSLGLGHYISDDNEINKKWQTEEQMSPSIMIPITHINPLFMGITEIDVSKVRQIYGSKGFSAFSSEPIPEPPFIPQPPTIPKPTPLPQPTPPIIPIFPFESIQITQDVIEVGRYEKQQLVKIIGDISKDEFLQGIPVYFLIKHPDQSFQTLKIPTTRTGHFETTLAFDDSSVRGTYHVEASYLEHQDRNMDITFRVVDKGAAKTPPIPKFDEVPYSPPIVSGIGEFDVTFYDNEYTFSGFLAGYDGYVRFIAENECPIKKEVYNHDYVLSSKRNTAASFTFHQLSQGKPDQCSIHLTMSDFDGNLLDQRTVNYKIQINKQRAETFEGTHPFDITKKQEKVPSWIKNNAGWWAEGQISDSDFVSGIQFMIKEKIINIPDLSEQASVTVDEKLPDWLRNNAKWWSDGVITEDDFVKGIEYMIKNGIIQVN